ATSSIDLDSLTPNVDEEDCDERWQQHAQASGDGVELARMRVHEQDAAGNRKIEIILPDLPDLPAVPTNYTLDVRNPASTNLYVFDELSKPEVVGTTTVKNEMPASGSANNPLNKPRRPRPKVARRPRVTGKIMHECLVSPVINDSYRAVMRARQQKASQPKRTIKRVNEDVGTLNRMASGISTQVQANKFAAFTSSRASTKSTEKFTRMPRTELLDALFAGFLRYEYWSMKSLRDQTKQPEAYLREVLSEIATLLKAGPYVGHWVLKPQYAQLNRSKAAAQAAEAEAAEEARKSSPVKMDEDLPDGQDDDVDLGRRR
ncbi:transcription initiation factor IIF, beta subunit-domain-containing protein, partial [Melampsora americana]